MRNNRRAGHNYERDVVKFFKEKGYDARTSRYASREMDDLKIDIVGTDPFQVQCKYTKNQPDFHSLLQIMPKGHNVVFHKKNVGKGKNKSEIVVMDLYTFSMLVDNYIDNQKEK